MSSLPDDRTAKARIRDEALRLIARQGPDGVTMRAVAAAAGVSPALVVRHYGSGDGLRDAVDHHVVQVLEALLDDVVRASDDGSGPPVGLREVLTDRLPPDSSIPAYLGRMLVSEGPAGAELFRRLYAISTRTLASMAAAGTATEGRDPALRSAFLLVGDLAVLMLRHRLTDVLGVDPLGAAGMERWAAEVLTIYREGLGGGPDRPA